ncbi:ankyrin repeat-containing domain protein [Dactylonectria estremocensis]|uniref:Ankyrin repeat-containing domain protein n=1 Tax=Dactylonectria estremocensis TaxID=1079267 RepID=A0A9P9JG99_9HYPO|nr:ankyrin repeat-containing domain protein [Dactylonectria estremocensis]
MVEARVPVKRSKTSTGSRNPQRRACPNATLFSVPPNHLQKSFLAYTPRPFARTLHRFRRLQNAAHANPLVEKFQSAIYLASNNFLSDHHMDSLLKWISETRDFCIIDKILPIKGPTVEIFASRLLLRSVQLDDVAVVRSLLKNGANSNAKTAYKRRYVSALCMAIELDRIEFVKILIDNGADLNNATEEPTLLYLAVEESWDSNRDLSMLELLINAKAEVNARSKLPGSGDSFPLHCAVQLGNLAVAKLSLEAGADANVLTEDSGSPLQIATRNDDLEMVKLLLRVKANANLPAEAGRDDARIWEDNVLFTPIQVGALVSNTEIV